MWGLENFLQSLQNYLCNSAKNIDNFIGEIQALQFDGNFKDDLSIMQVDFR
jgi:sigma-B regulation protein RsbU (phosphoserine phosphatase)